MSEAGKLTLTDEDRFYLDKPLDWYSRNVREWWTRSEVVKANAALGIVVDR